ncbi:MAG: (2Fe-2S)-binding protein [Desulfobacterales bacterium]|nr:(2Fe-2S)-binding protein [Desulfobacterales bacterium]
MSKKIVCYCQDLTEADIIRSIEEGYDHIESLKRYTGAFMGPCQGKMCAANVMKLYAARTGRAAEDLRVPTMRPPVEPIPLGWLATAGEEDQDA